MADDIVTRLRYKQQQQEPWDMNKEPIFGEAADAIERLCEQVAYRDDVISMLRADVARLGSFLHPIGEEARRGV